MKNLAKKIIKGAKDSGSDAVKFQTIIPKRLVSVQQKERIHQLKKFQLSYNEFTKLSKVAKACRWFFSLKVYLIKVFGTPTVYDQVSFIFLK